MNIRWKPPLLLLTVFSIGGAQAQSQTASPQCVVSAAAIAGTSGPYRLTATLAQPAIGQVTATGIAAGIAQGFWHPMQRSTAGGEGRPVTGTAATALNLTASPNLFSESTELSLYISHAGPVSLVLYDLLGKPVQTLLEAEQPEGAFNMQLRAGNLSAGRYTVVLTTGGQQRSFPLVLVK